MKNWFRVNVLAHFAGDSFSLFSPLLLFSLAPSLAFDSHPQFTIAFIHGTHSMCMDEIELAF